MLVEGQLDIGRVPRSFEVYEGRRSGLSGYCRGVGAQKVVGRMVGAEWNHVTRLLVDSTVSRNVVHSSAGKR
jgi:hypothetical protein